MENTLINFIFEAYKIGFTMPYYVKKGKVPRKRHTIFRKPDNSLYYEELISTEGFSSIYSLMYHIYPPTKVLKIGEPVDVAPQIAVKNNMRHRAFRSFQVEPGGDYLSSRRVVLCNEDVQLYVGAPTESMTTFYKNGTADELIFIHYGKGVLRTNFGKIEFNEGDYLHVPRGVIFKLEFETKNNRVFVIESFSPIEFPRRYMNKDGQLLEHSPFHERDIRPPSELETYDEKGEFEILVKKYHQIFPYVYANHPFDLVGWDGHFYPYAFNILDFEPIVGRIHQPPPVHQNFAGRNFVVCSFVPRLYDFHPEAIPAPYFHSNVDSDEVLYYVKGEFMSRKNIEEGFISLHPIGIPHGPHPGAIEKSIGAKETNELAVMVDTFRPLYLTKDALDIEFKEYYLTWLD